MHLYPLGLDLLGRGADKAVVNQPSLVSRANASRDQINALSET